MKEEHYSEKRPCKPAVCAEKPVKSEMGEVMELLKKINISQEKMNSRIDQLEANKNCNRQQEEQQS